MIGSGLSGLACASTLAAAGWRVTVFDKGRGVGGRTSTRHADPWHFDHGAARLELGADELAEVRAAWEDAGVIAPWGASWIGVPGANALATHLARGLDVRTGVRVTGLVPGERWALAVDGGAVVQPFDHVVVSAPAPQARELIATAGEGALLVSIARAGFVPCIAAMVVTRTGLAVDEVAGTGPLAVAFRMDRRPGRPRGEAEAWVLHGTEAWSTARLAADPDRSALELARALPGEHHVVRGHRWRYARAAVRVAAPYALDPAARLAACGDWFEAGERAPAASRALLSGFALAGALVA